MNLIEITKGIIMDISKYVSYFHDGSITKISQKNNNIILTMRSSEVDPNDIEKKLFLSAHDRIQGRLHLEGVTEIIENKKIIHELFLNYDSGGIFDFDVYDKKIIISISWVNYPPKIKTDNFSVIEIKAEKIWWENLPEVPDYF